MHAGIVPSYISVNSNFFFWLSVNSHTMTQLKAPPGTSILFLFISSLFCLQLCLLAAANVAYRHKGFVMYIDTGNSFSAKRIAHFVGQVSHPYSREVCLIVHHIVLLYEHFSCFAFLVGPPESP